MYVCMYVCMYALRQSSDEGLTPETSAFSTLYGGQSTTSTYQITLSLNRYMATWNLFVN